MFKSDVLKEYLETNNTIQTNSLVFAEWNLNQPENIARIGNYRYRPGSSDAQYATIPSSYDINDAGNYYTGATDADAVIDGGVDDSGTPVLFTKPKDKFSMLYSLEECFNPFRPRSGINKPLYLGISGASATAAQYITNPSPYNDAGEDVVNEGYIVNRPRYYAGSKYDQFKYWTSYRTEGGNEYGVSRTQINGRSYIYDAAPFVVYEKNVPANRIVLKMQTNVGSVNLGDMRVMGQTGTIPDPFYGYQNQTTPVRWRIQTLKSNNSWVDIATFDENSVRPDGSTIIGPDGYVELSYGLVLPAAYQDSFTFAQTLSTVDALPTSAPVGYAYLVKQTEDERGTFYIYTGDGWQGFKPEYSWTLSDESITRNSKFVKTLVDPEYFWEQGQKFYRELDMVGGIRIVVDTMNRENCTFDLIELSPRLAVDLTDRVQEFSITKPLSDLGNGNIPVGTLLAGTGQVTINNNDFAFSDTNSFNRTTSKGSLVADYLLTNIKFLFYEVVKNVGGYDYYIPMKTLYSEGFPQSAGNVDQISIKLRDAFFILESSMAPSILLSDISLSNVITVLLDYIGFSNYVFKRIDGEVDPVIPYFFVAPNQNVAEVLNQLATATQSAMVFDEYNNFVTMSKGYLLPDSGTRTVDAKILGNSYAVDSDGEYHLLMGYVYDEAELPNEVVNGVFINRTNNHIYQQQGTAVWQSLGEVASVKLPNLVQISSENKSVNNNGQINYTKRYIQRNYGSTRQAMYNDEAKSWVYVPTLLWEVSGDKVTKSRNETATEQSAYSLAAMALNSDLSADLPTVVNNQIVNNVIDVGENVYNHARYNGYLYANGEVIKYDAIEYSVTGYANSIWINSVDEYQDYFLKLKFNGKMYPTGNIRIWTEPEYITTSGVTVMKPGVIAKHGRGQFGTQVVSHKAGLDSYWSSNDNVYGMQQEADYIFNTNQTVTYPIGLTPNTAAGISNGNAKESARGGIIKNTLAQKYWTEKEVNEFRTAQTGTVQSSALVFTGPSFTTAENPRNYVSYIHKPLNDAYKHFGTRMRIIGRVETGGTSAQTPIGSTPYISITPTSSDQTVNISGGSGGLGVMVNKETNNGYYFEIVALTTNNISGYYDTSKKQIASYSIAAGGVSLSGSGNSVVTLTTAVDHQFKVGEKIVVSGFTASGVSSPVNGEFTVTSVSARKITYDTGVSISATPNTGGTAEIYINTDVNINNVIFYKVVGGPDGKAYPVKLWSGLANILVDSGRFTGQYRTLAEENPTVYDLAVEYKDEGGSRRFYLYINDKQVGTVLDDAPLAKNANMCVFVRGSSKVMFENVYALTNNYSQNTIASAVNNISEVFGDEEINASEALRKYAVSGFVQAAYLGGISSYEPPQFNMYYDEFGTIMREAAHFNVKYDRAFPAIYARLAPTLNRIKTYSTSGFYAGAYGADFLIFNCVDSNINLDSSSGNYLTIQGITFTQNTTKTLTVDDYFNKVANFSDPQLDSGNLVYNPQYQKEVYNKIKVSRIRHGNQEFTIDSPFIQSDAAAEDILGWTLRKTMEPKKNVGLVTFGTQMLQLGDLVNLYHKSPDGQDIVSSSDKVYVVYNIEYRKRAGETSITTFLTEV